MTSSSSLSRAWAASLAASLVLAALPAVLLLGESAGTVALVVSGLALLAMLYVLRCLTVAKRSLGQVREVALAVARGEFESRILDVREGGALGETMWAINDLIDRIDAYVRETAASMDHVSRNLYYRRIVETGMRGGFLVGAQVINRATAATDAKVGTFKSCVAQFQSTIEQVVEGIGGAAGELNATAGGMEQTARLTQEQAASVAAAAEEASVNVHTVAGAAEELSSSITEIGAQGARNQKITGDAVGRLGEARERIDALQLASERIGEVVGLITKVASQTNMLALNATIEAVRAGESGQGFAVVAHEVKDLAAQTATATDEISSQVVAMQSASRDVVATFQGIGEAIEEVSRNTAATAAAVEQQSAATQEIAGSVTQASAGTQEVTGNIERVSGAASETGRAAEEVLGASGRLSDESQRLRGAVEGFLAEARKVA